MGAAAPSGCSGEVARAALFLLGDDARVITGEVLTVDAGWCVSG